MEISDSKIQEVLSKLDELEDQIIQDACQTHEKDALIEGIREILRSIKQSS